MAKGSIFHKLGTIALCAALTSSPVIALAADRLPLQEAIQKEFKPWQIDVSWFGKTPDAPGVQSDGSIWWVSFSDSLIGKGPNKPRKWLTERCNADQGTLPILAFSVASVKMPRRSGTSLSALRPSLKPDIFWL
jgi:hypothetical protein